MRKRNLQILGGETEQPSDSVEEDSGESVKSEDREQFNCFQENCDEVVRMESENINFLLIYYNKQNLVSLFLY
jgi:hypothetical protein